jgi:protein-S-isoprenylcysteine O-methyltransferase Ste14
MEKGNFKFIFAPIGVAIGIFVWIEISLYVVNMYGIPKLDKFITFIPHFLLIIIGTVFIVIWLPVFISGFLFLGRHGAVGQTDSLRTYGIYKYVRNPMYSGLSFTLLGTGILLNSTGVALAGLLWFVLTFIQAKREERQLTEKFDGEYLYYKSRTPMYIINFALLIKDLNHKKIRGTDAK